MPEQKPMDIREIMADYDKAVKFFHETPAEVWEMLGQKTALSVFKETSETITAYKNFLKEHHFSGNVTSMEEFADVPEMDKYKYIQKYGFNEVNSVKAGNNLYSFSLSSGTTDEPTVWPRYYQYEEFLPLVFDMFMRQYWQIDKKSTLFINAFALGPWIAGFTVHQAVRPLTQKHKFTLATTGADIDSIVYSIQKMSRFYDQVIIWSYPTFARTIIDHLENAKVNLRKLNLKMFIAGEGHTVEWRRYINKMISGKKEDITSIIDGYGVSEAGLLALGSAMTNLVRDLAHKDEALCKELFGKPDCVPALFQYNPASYFVEKLDKEVAITTKSTSPLIKYNLHDRGGVIKFRQMEEILKKHGYDYKKLIKKAGLPEDIVSQQPFVYCFGRRDDTVIIGGANIFPEQIAPALFNEKINDIHSFKLSTSHDAKQHQLFYVLLELREGLSYDETQLKKLIKKYHDIILKHLKQANMDFKDAYRIDPKVADPKVDISRFGTGPFRDDSKRTKPKLVI